MRRASVLLSKKSSSSPWMRRHLKDQFVNSAKKDGLRSRSAYKLEEVQSKLTFIKSHHAVVDLGAAPGGWSVAAASYLGDGGRLIAVDLLSMDPIDKCLFIQGDFTSEPVQAELRKLLITAAEGEGGGGGVDVVLSDMLHNTTGHKQTDHFRSMNLAHAALDFAQAHVKLGNGSSFFAKFLRGADDQAFLAEVRAVFSEVKVLKPAASRKESNEAYVFARGRVK